MSKSIPEAAPALPATDSVDPAERRSSPRHEAHSLVLLLEPMDQHGDRAWMVNISEGGLAIEMPLDSAPKEDSMVMVELPLGTSISRLKTRCRVRGITRQGGTASFTCPSSTSRISSATRCAHRSSSSVRAWPRSRKRR